MKKFKSKIISLIVLPVFFVNSFCYGLGTLPATQDPTAKLASIAMLIKRNYVRFADTVDTVNLLEINNSSCLHLSSGDYLVSRDLAKDDIIFVRTLVNGDYRMLVRLMRKEDPVWYEELAKTVFSDKEMLEAYREMDHGPETSVIDLLTKGFEEIYMFTGELVSEQDVTDQEKNFFKKFRIFALNGKERFFDKTFWDYKARNRKLLSGLAEYRLYRMTDVDTSFSVKEKDVPENEKETDIAAGDDKAKEIKDLEKEITDLLENMRQDAINIRDVKKEFSRKRNKFREKVEDDIEEYKRLDTGSELVKWLEDIKYFTIRCLYQESFSEQNAVYDSMKDIVERNVYCKELFKQDFSGTEMNVLEPIKDDLRGLYETSRQGHSFESKNKNRIYGLNKLVNSVIRTKDRDLEERIIKKIVQVQASSSAIDQMNLFSELFDFMLRDRETIPIVAPYVVAFSKVFGFYVEEFKPAIMFKLVDLINDEKDNKYYNYLRSIFLALTSGVSGQMRVHTGHDLRVRTRLGEYDFGVKGVIRSALHDNLGAYAIGLVERALLYWKTGDRKVLIDPAYEVDAFKDRKHVIPNVTFPRRVVEQDLDGAFKGEAATDKTKTILTLLDKKMVERGIKGDTFFERIRNIDPDFKIFLHTQRGASGSARGDSKVEKELKEIYDEISEETGYAVNIVSRGTMTDYVWAYKFLTARYNIGGPDTVFNNISNIRKIYSMFDIKWNYSIGKNEDKPYFEHLKDLFDSGEYLLLIKEIAGLRDKLKTAIDNKSYYDGGEMREQFQEDDGRDDTGNADGGAFIKNEKLGLYMLDKYIRRLEEFVLTNLSATRFREVNENNIAEVMEFISLLVRINQRKALASFSERDDADFLTSPDITYSQADDLLRSIMERCKNVDRSIRRQIEDAIRDIVEASSLEDLKKFDDIGILEDEIGIEQKKKIIERKIRARLVFDDFSFMSLMQMIDKTHDFVRNYLDNHGDDPVHKEYTEEDIREEISRYYFLRDRNDREEIDKLFTAGRKRLSAKGIGLVRLVALDIDTPPYAIFPIGMDKERILDQAPQAINDIENYIKENKLEGKYGTGFGDVDDPMIISVRTGGYFTMPGQLPTVTNVGMNKKSINGLAQRFIEKGVETGDAYCTAWDCYRRFLKDYAVEILEMQEDLFPDPGDITDMTYETVKDMALDYERTIKKTNGDDAVPDDPHEQIRRVISVVDRCWGRAEGYCKGRNIIGDWKEGIAVIFQPMVLGNISGDSGSGVLYTRDPNTGKEGLYGEFKSSVQGVDVVGHRSGARPISEFENRKWFKELIEIIRKADMHYGEHTITEMEFTVEEGRVEILQMRDFPIPQRIKKFSYVPQEKDIFVRAKPCSLGAYRGMVLYHDKKGINDKKLKRLYSQAKKEGLDGLILLADEINPADVDLLVYEAEIDGETVTPIGGVLTKAKSSVSHTSDIARHLNKTAVVGVPGEYDPAREMWRINNEEIPEGTALSIEGVSGIISKKIFPLKGAEDKIALDDDSGLEKDLSEEIPYDVEDAAVLLLDLLNSQLKEKRVYKVKYDVSRLTPSQIDIVKAYISVMKDNMEDPKLIKDRPFKSEKGKERPLISVVSTGEDFNGEGNVDISIPPEEALKDYLVRVIGMLNIAFAASNIPDDPDNEEWDSFLPLIYFIKNQYRSISGEDLVITNNLKNVVKILKNLVINLPPVMRFPIDTIEEYNKLAREMLVSA